MRKNIFIVVFIYLVFVLTSCSYYDGAVAKLNIENTRENKNLDSWIFDNFTKDYNIDVVYKKDVESSPKVEIVSASKDQIKPVLSFIHKVFIESLEKYAGKDFVRKYTPKEIRLFGGRNLNSYGAELANSASIGNVLSVYNVNTFDANNVEYLENLSREVFSEYVKYLLDINHSILEKFASTNFNPYNRWDISGDESKKVYHNKMDIMLRFGFFSDAAQLSVTNDVMETISALITTKPKILNNSIKDAVTIPEYTYYGDELVEQTNRANKAKITIENKIKLSKEYLKKYFNLDIDELNTIVLANLKKYHNNTNNI